MRASPRDEARFRYFFIESRTGDIELAVGVEAPPQFLDARTVAADQVEHVALEVGSLGDVHRRAGRFLRRLAGAVLAGPEEPVEDIVLVARQDQFPYGQTHLAGDMTGIDVAEVARGNGERHLF